MTPTSRSLAIASWACPVLLLGLVAAPWIGLALPWDPDESRYLEIAREMVSSGDWLVPTMNGVPYLEKPPLYLWTLAVTFKLFGASVLAARAVSLVSAWGAVLSTWWIARQAGGPRMGLLAGCILATSPLFLVLSTVVTLDMLLTLWVTAGVAAFVHGISPSEAARPGRRLAIALGYVFFALAVLTKGPVALAVPGLIWVCWRSGKPRAALLPPNLLLGSILFLVVAAPWFIILCVKVPLFADFFFVRGHLGRIAGTEAQSVNFHEQPFYFYLPVLLGGGAPWSLYLAAPWGTIRAELARGTWPRLAWSWIVPGFLFFSCVAGKLPTYVLPLFPGVALLAASRWIDFRDGTVARAWRLGAGTAAAVAAFAVTAVVAALLALPPDAWWVPLIDGPLALATLSLLGLGTLVSLVFIARAKGRTAFAILTTTAACVLAAGAWLKAPLDRSESVEGLALALERARQPGDAVVCANKYLPLFAFYLREPVLVAGARGELAFGSTELGARPDLFLDLAGLKERVHGAGRVFITVTERRLAKLEERMEAPLHVLAKTRSCVLVSNRAQPWPTKTDS